MFLEIILVMILIFLIIIASQNYARGGMQDHNLSTIINQLSFIKDSVRTEEEIEQEKRDQEEAEMFFNSPNSK